MSDRLPHELLREWADTGEKEDTFPSTLMDKHFTPDMNKEAVAMDAEAFGKLADEIERQYVPVPRFPDGEPVHEGSETRYGTVSFVDVEVSNGGWGNWVMHMEDGECVEGTLSQRVERPEPKAIDADGAETRRGKQDASDYIDENIGLYRDLIEAEMESAHGDWGCRYD